MMTQNERIARMHERADELRRQQTRRRMRVEGALTGVLGVCMLAVIVVVTGSSAGSADAVSANEGYAGASLLDSSVGGYVLVAVISFLFGAALTAFLRSRSERRRQAPENEE